MNATSSTVNFLVQGTGSNNAFQVNSSTGTSLLTILPNGNVGIGTTTPSYKLDLGIGAVQAQIGSVQTGDWQVTPGFAFFGNRAISQTVAGNYALLQDASGTTYLNAASGGSINFRIANGDYANLNVSRFYSAVNVGIGTGTPVATLAVQGTAGNNNILDITSSTGASVLRINPAGQVGIGTTSLGSSGFVVSPTNTLESALFTRTTSAGSADFIGNTRFRMINTAGATPNGQVNAIEFDLQDAGGNIAANMIGIGAYWENNATATQASGLAFAVHPAGYGGLPQKAMVLTSNSYLGINTSSPIAQLSVVGSGTVNPLVIASSSGAQLLTINNAGNVGIGSTYSSPPAMFAVGNGANRYNNPLSYQAFISVNNGGGNGNVLDLVNNYNSGGSNGDYAAIGFAVGNSTTDLAVIKGIQDNGAGVGGLSFVTNSGSLTEKMRISSIGNVNIATLTASSLVMSDVAKNLQSVILGTGLSFSGNTLNAAGAGHTGSGVNGQVAYWTSATNITSAADFLNNGTVVGVNATSSTVNFLVQGTGSNIPFQVNTSTGTSLITVLGNGNVGIGVASPVAKLNLVGDELVSGGGVRSGNVAIGAYSGWGSSADELLDYGSTLVIQNTGSGYVSVGTPNTVARLAVQNIATTTFAAFDVASSSGTSFLRVTALGNVGIGTSTPGDALSVVSNATSAIGLYSSAGALTAQLQASSGQLIANFPGVTSGSTNWFVQRFNGASNKIYMGDDGSNAWVQTPHALNFLTGNGSIPSPALTPQMVLTTGGNVGIGTTTASAVLTVQGSSAADQARFIDNSNATGLSTDGGVAIINLNQTNNSYSSLFLATKDSTGGTVYPVSIQGVYTNHTNGAVAGDLVFSNMNGVARAETMRLTSGNNVGIGTSTPAFKLDIAGGDINIASSNAYRYNGSIIAYASTTLNNYFFGGAGNLTMSGANNTAMGYQALLNNTTGPANTAIGIQAMYSHSTGNSNTALGEKALYSLVNGGQNTALGSYALNTMTTGTDNTAVGRQSMQLADGGSFNIAMGRYSLMNNTGDSNVALGYQALLTNATSSGNTALGTNAIGNLLSGGGYNTALGYSTGPTLTTGTNNILIGNAVDVPASNTSNFLNIANIIFATGTTGTLGSPAGNVGIGTRTPTALLTVTGTGMDNNGDPLGGLKIQATGTNGAGIQLDPTPSGSGRQWDLVAVTSGNNLAHKMVHSQFWTDLLDSAG